MLSNIAHLATAFKVAFSQYLRTLTNIWWQITIIVIVNLTMVCQRFVRAR